MDSTTNIASSISSTLHDLDFVLQKLSHSDLTIFHQRLICYLHSLKIFLLISARNLDNQGDDADLPSYFLRVEDTVHKLGEQFHPDGELTQLDSSVAREFANYFRYLHEELHDDVYTDRQPSMLLKLSGSVLTIDDISAIISSILELIEHLNIHSYCGGMGALLEQVKVLQTLICFVDFHPTPQLLDYAKNVVIRVHIHFMRPRALHQLDRERFDYMLFKGVETIKPNTNPQVAEIFTQSLISSKLSRQEVSLAPTHHQQIDDDATFIATKNFFDSLLSYLWELLRINPVGTLSVRDQMQELYRKLRSLRTILKTKLQPPNNIKADIVSLLYDAGVLIFSLFQSHTQVDPGCCFHDCLETTKTILLQLGEEDPPVAEFTIPKANQLGFVDFVLQKLVDLRSREAEPNANSMHVQTIHEELVSLRCFLGDIVEFYQEDEELQAVWNRVLEVAYKVECLMDHLLVADLPISSPTSVDAIMEDIRDIKPKIEVKRPKFEGKRQESRLKVAAMTPNHLPSLETNNEVVGFVDDAKLIMDRLKRGSKQLKVIAIVGMPGLGKTTLSTKVYNDNSILLHFQVQAWSPISQTLDRKNVLSTLLKQVDPDSKCSELNDQDLVETLWRRLKRKRYLILLDDMWDIEAWNSLAPAFPDDNYGSRILLTSRHHRIAPSHMLDQEPYFLQPLNEKESRELFQRKLFPRNDGSLDPAVQHLVMQFVAYSKGLPLTIILIAGILGTTEQEDWVKIWKDLSSASVAEHCMDSLELSYKRLPDHLKSCMLYFGAFPEDAEIPTDRLLYLWMAEGFVRETEGKRTKDVAEEYLNGLIARSLIMVTQKRWNGRVKTCRIHDLILDYCLQKANDDHFLHLVKGYDELSAFNEPHNLRRLCIHSEVNHFKSSKLFCPRARSLLFKDPYSSCQSIRDASFVTSIFKLLRVMDLEGIDMKCEFPSEITLLVQLAFLAIQGDFDCIPSSIGKLLNLEALIVVCHFPKSISLPHSLWNLQKLKYLWIGGNRGIMPIENIENSQILYELDVLYGVIVPYKCSMEGLMTKFPNIRELKCCFSCDEYVDSEYLHSTIVVPDFLTQLESASLSFHCGYNIPKKMEFSFPENLKELELGSFDLSRENLSTIGELPNLHVFILKDTKLEGETWEMQEGEFSQLIILRLNGLKLVSWTADDDQFECLQKLELIDCKELEEMPCNCLETIQTLETIEVFHCSELTKKMVKQIEEQQEQWGNSNLKVLFT
ncbi:OLC1v1013999C1 [Oldenlandia corymbosa var. corymbosa]|uniref:OLC1v1013999C1 n=1 Tax=Oldenlandia corymbosa var. corymbosa TaxID=529605 RepID=A0AAV1E395_OLDCO|nr:OLC1v1013999C1 [Oldenlandia corymbosa var. corymbosa]